MPTCHMYNDIASHGQPCHSQSSLCCAALPCPALPALLHAALGSAALPCLPCFVLPLRIRRCCLILAALSPALCCFVLCCPALWCPALHCPAPTLFPCAAACNKAGQRGPDSRTAGRGSHKQPHHSSFCLPQVAIAAVTSVTAVLSSSSGCCIPHSQPEFDTWQASRPVK